MQQMKKWSKFEIEPHTHFVCVENGTHMYYVCVPISTELTITVSSVEELIQAALTTQKDVFCVVGNQSVCVKHHTDSPFVHGLKKQCTKDTVSAVQLQKPVKHRLKIE